jgi:predicted acyltransferase
MINEIVNRSMINRLMSIDAFRGLTIALMLIADNPGNPLRVYPQLRHAAWNGWTIADLAFPFFILIMGAAIPFAINKRMERGDTRFAIIKYILTRSIVLFFWGLFLNGFPLFDLNIIRIPGVLQRLAIVYLVTGLIYLSLKNIFKNSQIRELLVEIALAFGIILIYAWIFDFTSVSEQGNLLQKFDLQYLKGHLYLYSNNGDPEGILGTFSAIASGLFGLAAGQILSHSYKNKYSVSVIIFSCGALLYFLGNTLSQWIPINKSVWSSTYVLLTTGLAYLSLALMYVIIDLRKNVAVFTPFILLGSSPIIIYVASELVRKTLWMIPVNSQVQGKIMTLDVWITTTLFTPWAGDWLDSFYFSIFYVLLWWYIMSLYKRKA